MARIYVITGPMFSGKSDEMIRRLNLASYADMQSLVIKPKRDTRSVAEIASREKVSKRDNNFKKRSTFPAVEVVTPEQTLELIRNRQPDIMGVDEAQFLRKDFVGFFKKIQQLKEYKHLVIIISGLDMTSEGEPFGPMPGFMGLAEDVLKLKAVCFRCNEWPPSATMSYYKLGKKSNQVVVGDAEKYEARCLNCWKIPPV
jgi:thymidine kinase